MAAPKKTRKRAAPTADNDREEDISGDVPNAQREEPLRGLPIPGSVSNRNQLPAANTGRLGDKAAAPPVAGQQPDQSSGRPAKKQRKGPKATAAEEDIDEDEEDDMPVSTRSRAKAAEERAADQAQGQGQSAPHHIRDKISRLKQDLGEVANVPYPIERKTRPDDNEDIQELDTLHDDQGMSWTAIATHLNKVLTDDGMEARWTAGTVYARYLRNGDKMLQIKQAQDEEKKGGDGGRGMKKGRRRIAIDEEGDESDEDESEDDIEGDAESSFPMDDSYDVREHLYNAFVETHEGFWQHVANRMEQKMAQKCTAQQCAQMWGKI